ncbi:conserved hypothetical protein [Candidatus Desulfarcum epimagneticum]|uniref:Serine aminopeptidase S33 domain-containing protein n=1 Tax=uncultured Desulfobacteraceae bacterium TaxID=218296 RepID=A0A484HEC8_9BACT|nr:conserved hypothetical protein [uncultured Desulfobacteraceae bacterium]
MYTLIKIISWIFVFYCLYCLLLFFLQRYFIFPTRLIETPDGPPPDAGIEVQWLEMDFGKTETWFLPPRGNESGAPGPAILFAHGNAELIDFSLEEFLPYAQEGIGVLLVEYPGYGRSAGRPSEAAITQTLAAAYDMLAERKDVDPSAIALFGRSMGGGAVCALAEKRPAAALILTSTFTGLKAFARNYLVPEFLIRDSFDNRKALKGHTGPVLIMHGKYDEIVPYVHGKRLHRAAPDSSLITYECGHNDCPPDLDEFRGEVMAFLKKNGVI